MRIRKFRQARWDEPLIFELDRPKSRGFSLPEIDEMVKMRVGDVVLKIPGKLRRRNLFLPSLSETEVVRHYTRLSQMNFGVDSGMYPLGSCTMKYNPKVCDEVASLDKAIKVHPEQDEETVQGALEIMFKLERFLCEIGGLHRFSLQPAAGAHGELTGVLIIRAFHQLNGELEKRPEMILPDSAHGTNPASAAMGGFKVVVVPSSKEGMIDLEALKEVVSERIAGLMLTNPNTLGLFEEDIAEIADMVHEAGGLLYYDGANLNAILGHAKPGDMGFDVVHFNLHKTFGTPHGGGGPGAGPVGVKEDLEKFLPSPLIEYDEARDFYYFSKEKTPYSIGKIRGYHGNFGVLLRAYVYIRMLGSEGLKECANIAVLNANYLLRKIGKIEGLMIDHAPRKPRKHEFVVSAKPLKLKTGIGALEIAKRLIDFGVHAPTVLFPLIVSEALMIEPTESVTKDDLDMYAEIMGEIIREAEESPEVVLKAPHNTSVGRVDEVKAARKPVLSWKMLKKMEKDEE